MTSSGRNAAEERDRGRPPADLAGEESRGAAVTRDGERQDVDVEHMTECGGGALTLQTEQRG
jgi:hypothetical protein